MYDKIVAISQKYGFEKKMGNYIGVTITTADGKDRVVRCVSNEANQAKVNEIIFVIEVEDKNYPQCEAESSHTLRDFMYKNMS